MYILFSHASFFSDFITAVSNKFSIFICGVSKRAIKKWINDNMDYRSCVVVLVGEETANRYWVKYEIKKAWNDGKGLLGIYIHNLKDPRHGKSM